MPLTFTTIQHPFRKAHQLSMNEYTLCDMIYHLSTKPKSSVPGWCYMSKVSMGQEIGVSKQAILNMQERLISSGFLIKNPETKYLQTTQKWQKVYEFESGKESLPTVKKDHLSGKETLPDGGKETLPNNNNLDITLNNGFSENFLEELESRSLKVFKKAGLSGVFWEKVKKARNLLESELTMIHKNWVRKHDELTTEFNSDQHLKNSFSKFVDENSTSRRTETPQRARAGKRLSA